MHSFESSEFVMYLRLGSYNTASNPQHIAIMNLEKNLALYQARE